MVGVEGEAVDGVDDAGSAAGVELGGAEGAGCGTAGFGGALAEVVGGVSADDACLGGVGVDDVGVELGEEFLELAEGAEVVEGVDGASEEGNFEVAVGCGAGALDELALGAVGGAGDEGDVVAAVVEAFAGEEGVFLGAADDEACDDVYDFHGVIIAISRLRG